MAEGSSRRRDRQVVRILGILGTLLEGGRPTIRQLAARFGTRRETIYRDLRAIEDAGYPITGDETGRLSRPSLLPEVRRRVPELRFSDAEITALLWASKQVAAKSPFREALLSSATKLRAMASEGKVPNVDSIFIEGSVGMKDYGPHRE